MKTFPKLYKKSSTGAIQVWTIEAVTWSGGEPTFGVIRTRWGQVDGSVQMTEDVIREGKNQGKKNETTAYEQACREAEARWEKQLKKGYVKTLEEAKAGTVDEIIEGGVSPMLAHDFSKQGHKIVYPAMIQNKFDGHRCIAVIENGKATLWSRTRKPIAGLPHLVRDLEAWANRTGKSNIVLDGELYHHEYRSNFEELTSFIRSEEPKSGCEIVQYHIYDVAAPGSFSDRHCILSAFSLGGSLVAVETVAVSSEEEMMARFEEAVAAGYEGLMVRNMSGLYVNKRSYDLQKVKSMEDAEFEVVGVEEGRGKLSGHAIFVCCTAQGEAFNVKLKGAQDNLKKYFEHPELIIGKLLTVKFQSLTNKGVPRFPVGLRVRDDV